MPLFDVVVLEEGCKKEDLEKLVLGPVTVVAKTEQAAALQVVLENADKMPEDKSKMQVVVRPFA